LGICWVSRENKIKRVTELYAMHYPPAAVFQNEKATSLQPGGPIISGMPKPWCINLTQNLYSAG